MVFYEAGQVGNEFHLQEKLHNFIMQCGWSVRSRIDTFDCVYFSSGEDGYKDIYIRSSAGRVENGMYGGDQKDFGDGYVGWLNFFAYQYFPSGGDGYAGYGEAGKLGPRLYWAQANGGYPYLYQQNISEYSPTYKKWGAMGYMYPGVTYYQQPFLNSRGAFDGKRYYYFSSGSGNIEIARYDLAKEYGEDVDIGIENSNGQPAGMIYWIDNITRDEYLYFIAPNYTTSYENNQYINSLALRRYNITTGYTEDMSVPIIWPVGETGSKAGIGTDGKDHIYITQSTSNDDSSPTDKWGMYTIGTNSWQNLSPDLPTSISTYGNRAQILFLDKRITGFDTHRLYVPRNANVYYIKINENSGLPSGSWVSAGASPSVGFSNVNYSDIFHNGVNRFYFNYVDAGNRTLYYAPFASGTLLWSLVETNYYPNVESLQRASIYVDGYASRVRTSLYGETKYWFFGNKDFINVVTKSDGRYTYCYMGSFARYTSSASNATTSANISAGSNVVIPITNSKGEFIIGQQAFISDVTGFGGGYQTNSVENISRKFCPTEKFTITAVNPGISITANQIHYSFGAGSKIAYDPQPVGITLNGLDKIQMLNHINTSNTSGSFDMAENIAYITTVSEDIVNVSAGDTRRSEYALWPAVISKSGAEVVLSGTEIRGSLYGVFIASGAGTLANEDIISVGENNYIVLGVESGKTYKYVFGPVR